jgi:hypothetical protein
MGLMLKKELKNYVVRELISNSLWMWFFFKKKYMEVMLWADINL